MGTYYHGSSTPGLKELKTNPNATHGNYVYATPSKTVATIFCKRCGDDQVYSLFGDGEGHYVMVERIPNAFEYMFNNSASIYEVPSDTFVDMKTGFNEVLSEKDVPVLKETWIEDIRTAIDDLANEGLITLYHYPDRPERIPEDDNDLIIKEQKAAILREKPLDKGLFARCAFLHPHLIPQINEIIVKNGFKPFTEADVKYLIDFYTERSKNELYKEFYIDSALEQIKKIYPDLVEEKKR